MAILSYDQLINGLLNQNAVNWGKNSASNEAAGVTHTTWYTAGITGAGSAPTGALNGATFSGTVSGQIPSPAAVTGELSYLARWSAVSNAGIGALRIIDRLWGNVPVVTTIGAQAITSPTWPARDSSGGTNGLGVMLALETSSATGNGSPITNTTVSYTNSSGTAGRTATMASYPATAVQGTFVMFALQAGDVGVRSVQSITLGTSYVSGQVNLIAFRSIADMAITASNVMSTLAADQLGFPNVWDNSVLAMMVWPTGTTVDIHSGTVTFAQG